MERIVEQYRNYSEPLNMKYFLNFMTFLVTGLNLQLAFINAENMNVITGIVGLFFLIVRNLPVLMVRFWELRLFTKKRHRVEMIRFWREYSQKQLNDPKEEKEDDESK
jgi:hypothetical protein